MKYGIREICDVVLKSKKDNKPIIYFDSLKTSTMEGAATTVYAQGGRGNSRLVAWEGERTVTFTMEDALISELGLSVLTGAGLVDATEKPLKVHTTARFAVNKDNEYNVNEAIAIEDDKKNAIYDVYAIEFNGKDEAIKTEKVESITEGAKKISYTAGSDAKAVMFDFYVTKSTGAKQIEITADKFAGNYYLEASTLFRSQDGVDHPAEFVIPNCKIQSNFTFTMASSGDPSTFTFTMDAFPDYTKFDPSKKVFCAIQIIDEEAPIIDEEEETDQAVTN